MILAEKNNNTQLMALIPSIKRFLNEWHVVNINMHKNSVLTRDEVIERMLMSYAHNEGMIYHVSSHKIIMLVRLGIIKNYTHMKGDIERTIPEHCCRILLRAMTDIGMKQLQIDLTDKSDSLDILDNMYRLRESRKDNVLMIADDDQFVRMSMSKLLATCGHIVEAADGASVVKQYLKHNPDILFLDIHMPQKNGLELIEEIIEVDPDANIVVLSADSMKDNVLKALDKGAVGFLSKPPLKKKVQVYLSQCITIR